MPSRAITSQICSRSSGTPCARAVLQRHEAVGGDQVGRSRSDSDSSGSAARCGMPPASETTSGLLRHREQCPDLRCRHPCRARCVAAQVGVEASGALLGRWGVRASVMWGLLTGGNVPSECNCRPVQGICLPGSVTSAYPRMGSLCAWGGGRGVATRRGRHAGQPGAPLQAQPDVCVLGARPAPAGAGRGVRRHRVREGGLGLQRAAGVGLLRTDHLLRRHPRWFGLLRPAGRCAAGGGVPHLPGQPGRGADDRRWRSCRSSVVAASAGCSCSPWRRT